MASCVHDTRGAYPVLGDIVLREGASVANGQLLAPATGVRTGADISRGPQTGRTLEGFRDPKRARVMGVLSTSFLVAARLGLLFYRRPARTTGGAASVAGVAHGIRLVHSAAVVAVNPTVAPVPAALLIVSIESPMQRMPNTGLFLANNADLSGRLSG